MGVTRILILLFVVTGWQAAESGIKASGTLDGKKARFPAKSLADGVKASIRLLQSCHNESSYSGAELRKAEQGDYVRFVFAKSITVVVMGEKVELSEVVVRLPLNTGVIWVRSGEKMRRYSKFEPEENKRFVSWLRQAATAG
jgi:hypothetical protein